MDLGSFGFTVGARPERVTSTRMVSTAYRSPHNPRQGITKAVRYASASQKIATLRPCYPPGMIGGPGLLISGSPTITRVQGCLSVLSTLVSVIRTTVRVFSFSTRNTSDREGEGSIRVTRHGRNMHEDAKLLTDLPRTVPCVDLLVKLTLIMTDTSEAPYIKGLV